MHWILVQAYVAVVVAVFSNDLYTIADYVVLLVLLEHDKPSWQGACKSFLVLALACMYRYFVILLMMHKACMS